MIDLNISQTDQTLKNRSTSTAQLTSRLKLTNQSTKIIKSIGQPIQIN